MQALLDIWRKSPARVVGFVVAALALAVAFGIPVGLEQQNAIIGIVTALIVLLGGEVTRSQVYSPNTIEGPQDVSEVGNG